MIGLRSQVARIREASTALSLRSPSKVLHSQLNRSYASTIDPRKLVEIRTTQPKQKLPNELLVFGRSFSDHMLTIDWNEKTGWAAPKIHPYGDLSISPASTGLHYGIQCFEGMKAYKDSKGNIRMFRPDRNMARMNFSMQRFAMPELDMDGFLECIKQLLRVERSWIPSEEGYSMYIRPTAVGTSSYLGVHASEDVKLFTILSPVGPYYKGGFKPVKLFAGSTEVRAWPGGVGNAKVGGNYAPTILPSKKVADQGYSQILWLFGEDDQVTEVGAMNIFFVLQKAGGGVELVTPPLTRGDILPGVTRQSILELARSWGDVEVSERWITMGEIQTASEKGQLLEAFGAGTAAVVCPVKGIHYKGKDISVPTGENAGPMAQKFWKTLIDIQYGRVDHPWSVVI